MFNKDSFLFILFALIYLGILAYIVYGIVWLVVN